MHWRSGFGFLVDAGRKPAVSKNYRTRAPLDSVADCMWIFYQLIIFVTLLVAGPFLLLRRGRHYLASISGRLGFYHGVVDDSPLWIHAVSVGEVAVASTLIRALPENLPILLTTITPTGQDHAIKTLGDRATIAFLPFDLGFVIEKFLRRFRPRGLVLVEGDFWPLLLERTSRRDLPIVVVNGRVSDQSFRRMSRLKPLLGPIFNPVDRFGMQTPDDGERLEDLDIPSRKIEVLGNLKFDSAMPQPLPEVEAALADLAGDRPILIVASNDDPQSAQSSQTLADLASDAQLQIYETAGHGIAMLVFGVLFSVFVLAVTASRYQQSEAKAQGLSAQEYVRQVLDTFVVAWGGITIVWLIGSAIVEYKHLEYPGDKNNPNGGDHH